MNTSEKRIFEMALLGLQTERARIEQELTDIQRRLNGKGVTRVTSITRVSPNKGKAMGVAQKKAISVKMKQLWAKRRKAAKAA